MKEKGEHYVPHDFIRYSICKAMGWGIETYRSQPMWFINELITFENIEAKYHNRDVQTTKF